MEKVAFFLDYANINRSASTNGLGIDYKSLLDYISEGRFLIDAYCYVPIDPRNEHRLDNIINELWDSGYLVTKKIGTIAGDSYKCNFDVEMTMDMIRVAHNVKPDIIVIASGDSDFLPVVFELRKMGIRAEVACFQEAMSRKLWLQSSGFIDLSILDEPPVFHGNAEHKEEARDRNEQADEAEKLEEENDIIDLYPVETETE